MNVKRQTAMPLWVHDAPNKRSAAMVYISITILGARMVSFILMLHRHSLSMCIRHSSFLLMLPILVFLSPIILCCTKLHVPRWIHIASSILSFIPTLPVGEYAYMFLLALAVSSHLLLHMHLWTMKGQTINISAFQAGLMLFVTLRYSFYSLDILEQHAYVASLACSASILYLWSVHTREDPLLGDSPVYMLIDEHPVHKQRLSRAHGVAFGSSLFLLMTLFSGYSVIPRWAALEPYHSSLVVICSLFIGILVGNSSPLHHPIAWPICVMAVGLMSFMDSGLALTGGCLLGIFIPSRMHTPALHPNQKPTFLFVSSSLITYISLSLAFLFTSSTFYSSDDSVLFGRPWISLWLAVLSFGFSSTSTTLQTIHPGISKPRASLRGVLCVLAVILVAGAIPSTLVRSAGYVVPFRRHRSAVPMNPIPIGIARSTHTNSTNEDPSYSGDSLVIASLNVNQGLHAQLGEFIDSLRSSEIGFPKIIGLLEVESNFLWTGNFDIVEYLAYTLKMYPLYGSNPRDGTIGAAILSAFPFQEKSVAYIMPESKSMLGSMLLTAKFELSSVGLPPLHVLLSQMSESNHSDKLYFSSYIQHLMSSVVDTNEPYSQVWMNELDHFKDQDIIATVFDWHCTSNSHVLGFRDDGFHCLPKITIFSISLLRKSHTRSFFLPQFPPVNVY